MVAQYRAAGFTFIAIASDLGLLMRGAQAAVAAVRANGQPAQSPTGNAPAAPITSNQPQGY